MQFAVWSALLLCACFAVGTVRSGALIVNSINAIKSQMIPINSESPPTPGTPSHGLGPLLILEDMAAVESSHNLQLDSIQSLTCSADAECSGGFCLAARGACLPCKRRRKRCTRDAMCCHGNQCSNGVCGPVESDIVQQFSLEDVVVTSPTSTLINSTSSASGSSSSSSSAGTSSTSTSSNTLLHMNDHEASPTVALPVRGLEGDGCLRSSDCSDGLCCARHFWSKICKPVLREGQVCTKHKKKGALGLEIFQRCDCGAGLVCRTQRELHELRLNRGARSLHTCQQH